MGSVLYGWLGVELVLIISIAVVVHRSLILLGVFSALSIGLTENIVGEYPVAETSVAW